MAALSGLLYLGTSVPLLEFVVILACPLPVTVVGVRHGGRRAALAALCAAALVALLSGPHSALFYLAPFGLLGAITGHLIHRDEEPVRMLALGTGLVLIAVMPLTLGLEAATGLATSTAQIGDAMAWAAAGLATHLPLADPAARAALAARAKDHVRTLMRVPVWFFFLFSLLLFYTNHLATFLIFWRLRIPVPPPPDLRRLRLPRSTLAAMVALAAGYALAGGGSGTIAACLAANGVAIGAALGYAEGLAVLACAMDRRRLRPGWRFLVTSVAMFPAAPLTAATGLADTLADFRARAERVDDVPLARF
jgi:uncharacterized protein YybS (DUF2232 family)